jgi:L-asparagine transporter-like permease
MINSSQWFNIILPHTDDTVLPKLNILLFYKLKCQRSGNKNIQDNSTKMVYICCCCLCFLLWFMFVVVVCIRCYGLYLLLLSVFLVVIYVCYYGLYLLLWFMFVIMVCICCYGSSQETQTTNTDDVILTTNMNTHQRTNDLL